MWFVWRELPCERWKEGREGEMSFVEEFYACVDVSSDECSGDACFVKKRA